MIALTFFRTAPELQNISFSGVDPSVLEVQFTAYLDATKAKGINLWAYGNSFQDVLL